MKYETQFVFHAQGDVVDIVKEANKTEVMVKEGPQIVAYPLDDAVIEFGTAVEEGDFARAAFYLEGQGPTNDTQALWKVLSDVVQRRGDLHLMERCYAAAGDVSKVRYLQTTNRMREDTQVDEKAQQSQYRIDARLALLDGDHKKAELIYLENDDLEAAIDMYKRITMWGEALELAKTRHYHGYDALVEDFYRWLMSTSQEAVAAKMKEMQGEFESAYELCVKAGAWSQAANLLITHRLHLLSGRRRDERIKQVTDALVDGDLVEQAGWFQEELGNTQVAYDYYQQAKNFPKAMKLARVNYPDRVIELEEAWGDYLVSRNQLDAAVGHFIEGTCVCESAEFNLELA